MLAAHLVSVFIPKSPGNQLRSDVVRCWSGATGAYRANHRSASAADARRTDGSCSPTPRLRSALHARRSVDVLGAIGSTHREASAAQSERDGDVQARFM